MTEELNPAEQAGIDAADCIMPGLIAAQLEPSLARLTEMAAQHTAQHWEQLDDDGKLAMFVYVSAVCAKQAAEKVTTAMQDFVAGGSEPFTAKGWPIRTDGGL